MKFLLLLVLTICLVNVGLAKSVEPRGVKLALTKSSDSMRVTWWTEEKMLSPVVLYSTKMFTPERDSSFAVQAEAQKFDKSDYYGYPTTAVLPDLEESTTYFYYVGDKAQGVYSNQFNFTTGLINKERSNSFRPFKSIFFGDMGYGETYTTVDNILSRLDDDLSFVAHVGDIAYADVKNGGVLYGDQTVYNLFLDAIEPITSNKPYLVCPGNHDVFNDQSYYLKTWQMPTDKHKDSWYSFDYNGVRFVSFSSEHDWSVDSSQYKWIEKQLKSYRESNPDGWLVVYSHRPVYCSAKWKWCSSDNKKVYSLKKPFVKAIEKLLYKYNVNLYIGGHSHSVEYTYPVYKNQVMGDYDDPKATVHITVGTGGNVNRLLKWYDLPSWANDFRSSDNGFGVLNFVNETHLNWQFISNEEDNQVINEFYLAKGQF
ncbi:hypothetical protein DICPUDRAFT_40191 [Dictyostelium purpureum]|uniref:Purple acid phosphatase n=1 Tax=Dictyostelium purpureum TaxID=5786 RepID=F0ZXR4_DICPU|nr:uncharacterized protein DICPUDRAFT_40191 [Dictyostelium purpureum]EGC31257.1 hypothetical protein DICPUDRAFT_40191 [Dictyostelium purpureum]|eukprot:XP_003292202.1 hypothetical protein DICPUDRAFT_40191 [Dictyostelium purpureum]